MERVAPRPNLNLVTEVSEGGECEVVTDKYLEEIEERCEAATAGPWVHCLERSDGRNGFGCIRTESARIELSGATIADQEFIARARQDLPALLLEVRRLRMLSSEDRFGIW